MLIGVAQLNCTVGDLTGNSTKILDFAKRARALGVDLLVTPELSLSGYPPEDLLLRGSFNDACAQALRALASQVSEAAVLVGHPLQEGDKVYNAASILRDGKVLALYRKQRLPNNSVFDEERYFEPGHLPCVVELNGVRVGLNICEDIWFPGSAELARAAGAEVLVVPNGSPYHMGKQGVRYDVVGERVTEARIPLIYANLVGGQDELVFDGASFAMDRTGQVTHQFPAFEEALGVVELRGGDLVPGDVASELSLEASVYQALCMGVRDYVTKNGFPGVLIGLSGGIDSALTLCVAADALGADKVHAVMMPSQYTADISLEDAARIAENLRVKYSVIEIKPVFDAFVAALAPEFKNRAPDTTEENLQARIRGTLLMALSNKYGSIVLTTGNKSEMAVGYCTLYGDMAGGFAVIKDISKTLVYRLSRYRNSLGAAIPERIITRAPSAELRPDQTDQDSLPPYDVLDGIMVAFMEQNQSPSKIIAQGYRPEDVRRVVKLIKLNEYKRRQAPVGVRITDRGFGRDWRYPITSKYNLDI
jgi:NAD+ synthase (glutamine-hydrolysing)